MNRYRSLTAILIVAFCVLGNVGYLVSTTQGRASVYSQQMDTMPIKILCWIFFALILFFAVSKNPEDSHNTDAP